MLLTHQLMAHLDNARADLDEVQKWVEELNEWRANADPGEVENVYWHLEALKYLARARHELMDATRGIYIDNDRPGRRPRGRPVKAVQGLLGGL